VIVSSKRLREDRDVLQLDPTDPRALALSVDGDLSEPAMNIQSQRAHLILPSSTFRFGEVGQRDNCGFALAAQPDQSQGRPDVQHGLAVHT